MKDLSTARIGQISITCKDVARATAFYRDMLGVPFLFSAGPNLAFLNAGGTRLMLSKGENAADVGTSALYFFVNDIHATRDSLGAKGVQFLEEPHVIAKMPDHDLWLAAFRDSEGNLMALMEEQRGG
jgi:methylmalonyl-CoA/ethylmalonyl-CoA epimerase